MKPAKQARTKRNPCPVCGRDIKIGLFPFHKPGSVNPSDHGKSNVAGWCK